MFPRRFADLLPALLLILAVSAGLAALGRAPGANTQVAMVFPPWVDAAGAIRAVAELPPQWRLAGRTSRWSMQVVTLWQQDTPDSASAARLRTLRQTTGAWFAASTTSLIGCLVSSGTGA